uniref:Myb-like domain-containing protein n=2 Tax=Aegilops tauschii subsp. strangulata TaxID=200361 RepID=A0A453GRT9_AEGTS
MVQLKFPSAWTTAVAATDGLSDEEEEEDLALVRSIRENLHLNKASPSSPRPICIWPPSFMEDDLETLRAIQRRFSHYHSGTSTGPLENMKNEASKGGDDEFIAHRPGEEDVQSKNTKALTQTGFPKAALLLVDALKKNRACQKFIRRKMINIEAKIEVNKDLRDRVKCLMDYQLSCRRSFSNFLCQKVDPRVRLISSEKQSAQSAKEQIIRHLQKSILFLQNKCKMSPLLLGPAENPHIEKYKVVLKQFPISLQKHSWSDTEKDRLAKGIKQQYQEMLIKDSMKNGSSSGDFSAVDMAYALTNTGGNFEATHEILRSVLPLVNWDYIAAMYLPGRSGAECESRWLNYDDPLINHNAWTACEEKRLILTVQERGMHNWINIAVALGTQRTPFQCFARYQ